jgi:hypothetical protein
LTAAAKGRAESSLLKEVKCDFDFVKVKANLGLSLSSQFVTFLTTSKVENFTFNYMAEIYFLHLLNNRKAVLFFENLKNVPVRY